MNKVKITITKEVDANHSLVYPLWDANCELLPLNSESMAATMSEECRNGFIDTNELLYDASWKVEVLPANPIDSAEVDLKVEDAPPSYYRRIAFNLLAERVKLLKQIESLTKSLDHSKGEIERLIRDCDGKYKLGKRDGYREVMFAIEELIEGVN